MAQIIALHPGLNNGSLDAAVERINTSGVWKKQRIAYVIPMGETIPGRVHIAHRGLIFPPNQAMTPIGIEGAEVGEAFQTAVDAILGNPELRQWEYMLTIEHDNIPQQNGVLKLIEKMEAHPEYAAISGLYWTKYEGGVPQIWGDIRDPVQNYRPQRPQPGQVIECHGIGMGFALWRLSMFAELDQKKVPRPWFKTVGRSSADNGMGTQDLYFWGNVGRPNGFRCAVDCDTLVGHIDVKTGVIW